MTVWSIFSETKYPEEAVKVLGLLYSDEDVLNTILYGVEGMHYEVQEDGSFAGKHFISEITRLTEAFEATSEEEVIDAEGLIVIPGLVDIHSHGAYGEDFSDGDPEGLKKS